MRQNSPANSSTKPMRSLRASSRSTVRAEPKHSGATPANSLRLCAVNGPAPSASSLSMTWKPYLENLRSALLLAILTTSGPKSLECSPCSMSRSAKQRTRCSNPASPNRRGVAHSAESLAASPARPLSPSCMVAPVSSKTARAIEEPA